MKDPGAVGQASRCPSEHGPCGTMFLFSEPGLRELTKKQRHEPSMDLEGPHDPRRTQ